MYAGAPLTLLVFADSACQASQDHHTALREVLADAQQGSLPAHLILTSPERPEDGPFIAALGVDRESVTHYTPASATLRWVPAVVVVDAAGTALHGWLPGDGPAALRTLSERLALRKSEHER